MTTPHRLASQRILTLGLLTLGSAALSGQVLLNEMFSGADLNTQNLPTSAAWFNSSTSGASLSSGALSITSGRSLAAFFTAAGSPQALTAAGDSLVLSFDVAYSAATDPTSPAALKVAVFNSAEVRPTAQGVNNIYAPYSGYAVSYAYQTVVTTRERPAGTTNVSLLTSIASFATVGSGTTLNLVDEPFPTYYLGTFSLTRNGEGGLDLSYTLTEKLNPANTFTYAVTAASPVTLAFDTIAFANTTGTDMVIDNVKVEYFAIPEPSTFAALAGALVLFASVLYRRRRA